MAFGRRFESASGAYFRKEDCGAALFKEWGAYRDAAFEYKRGETWDRLLHQGIQSGIPEAALIVFVRKHAPEVQYLRATISGEQRQEFCRLVETTVNQIEAGHFNFHSGIRFPQSGCVSCPHLGLCLHNDQLVAANLVRKAGASNLDWLDELVD